MVNDAEIKSSENNAAMKIVVVKKKPHLCLFATRNIGQKEEIRYDYNVPNLPWRKKGKLHLCSNTLSEKHIFISKNNSDQIGIRCRQRTTKQR